MEAKGILSLYKSLNLGATQAWTPGSEDLQLFGLCIGLQLPSRPKPPLKTLLTMQFLDSQTKHHDLQSWDLPSPHLHAEQVPDGMRSAIPGHLTCYVFALRLNYSEGQRHSMGLRVIQCLNLMFAGFLYTHWFLCVVLKNNSSSIVVPVTLRALIICIMGLSALPNVCALAFCFSIHLESILRTVCDIGKTSAWRLESPLRGKEGSTEKTVSYEHQWESIIPITPSENPSTGRAIYQCPSRAFSLRVNLIKVKTQW